MLDWINHLILTAADPVLGWLLRLPTDLALFMVAVGTGSIITFSRLFSTNQDLLRRCHNDKRRLKELIREAKRKKDKNAVNRHRLTLNMVGMTTMRQEGWPLLAAIVPIAFLGTWCFQRLAFVPPQAGETVTVTAYFPVSAVGELAHMTPQPGVREATPGGGGRWIQEIVKDPNPGAGAPAGVAVWHVQAEAAAAPYRLRICHKTCAVEAELRVGQRIYAPDAQLYGETGTIWSVQLGMKPVKLFGIVPGLGFLGLPPWLAAYFLIAIPSVSLIKRLAKIY